MEAAILGIRKAAKYNQSEVWVRHPKGHPQILGDQGHPTLEREPDDLWIAGLCQPDTANVIHRVAQGRQFIRHARRNILIDQQMHQARIPTRISSSRSAA